MENRRLGSTEIEVSAICMGCWNIADEQMWGPQEEREAIETIRAALDAGVNFFDTAEAYGDGRSEVLLSKGLGSDRQRAVIATKVSPENLAAGDLIAACESSLKRLDTDYIDLYQIHWPSPVIPIDETMEALLRLRQQGKIRAIGVSNFGPGDLTDALKASESDREDRGNGATAGDRPTVGSGPIAANQVPYSLLWRAIEYEIVPFCQEHDVGILAYTPLMHGLLTGKFDSFDDLPEERMRTRHFSTDRPLARHGGPGYENETEQAIETIRDISREMGSSMTEVALSWVMRQPGVTSVIAGARKPGQISENAGAAELDLPAAVDDALDRATRELKEALGSNPDMWKSDSRYR